MAPAGEAQESICRSRLARWMVSNESQALAHLVLPWKHLALRTAAVERMVPIAFCFARADLLHCRLRGCQVLESKGWGFLAEDKSEPRFAFKLMDTAPWERARGASFRGWEGGGREASAVDPPKRCRSRAS